MYIKINIIYLGPSAAGIFFFFCCRKPVILIYWRKTCKRSRSIWASFGAWLRGRWTIHLIFHVGRKNHVLWMTTWSRQNISSGAPYHHAQTRTRTKIGQLQGMFGDLVFWKITFAQEERSYFARFIFLYQKKLNLGISS